MSPEHKDPISRLPNRQDWQLIAEFLFNPAAESGRAIFDPIQTELLRLKLHPKQIHSIQEAIDETSLQWRSKNTAGHAEFPLQIKFYLSALSKLPDRSGVPVSKMTNGFGSGLSYFLIKRVPEQPSRSSRSPSLVIDVFIYSE